MMQELEKILEEIDAIKTGYDTECASECDLFDWSCGACVGECDEYIKEKAKEIIRKHMNDGWIPVDEQLPEVDADIEEIIEDDDCPEYIVTIRGASESTVLKYSPDGAWFDDNGNVYDVIAWRPLPEPYRPERSERMSDDLISRKAVLDILTEERMRNSILASPAFTEILVQRVKDLPTAFNKEKVIAELNVKADYARDRWLNPTKEGYSKYWDGKENGFREALEIVERGGIE